MDGESTTAESNLQQHHGDKTGEISTKPALSTAIPQQHVQDGNIGPPQPSSFNTNNYNSVSNTNNDQGVVTLGKSPGEIAFFKLLHTEFKKASHFFDRATEEFSIREVRVREGMEIMRRPNAIMVNDKWSLMAKSIYRLYKDLLLLETFAIMTYCSFSKILKKHDKVTGYDTKNAFMANIVNKANFTNYPSVLTMIGRCEQLYEEVSLNLLREGKEALYEDEREFSPWFHSWPGCNCLSSTIVRSVLSGFSPLEHSIDRSNPTETGLFINMIHRLNEQVLDSSDNEIHSERKQGSSQRRASTSSDVAHLPTHSDRESKATSTLRNLVEENAKASPAQFIAPKRQTSHGGAVSEEHNEADEDDSEDDCGEPRGEPSKRLHVPSPTSTSESTSKRLRTV